MARLSRGIKIVIWCSAAVVVGAVIVLVATRPQNSGYDEPSQQYDEPSEQTLRLAQNLALPPGGAEKLQASLDRLISQAKTPSGPIMAAAKAFVLANDREGLMSDSRKEVVAEFINVTQTSTELTAKLIEMGHGLGISTDGEWTKFFDSVNDVRQATGDTGDQSAQLVLQLRNLFETLASWGVKSDESAPQIVRNFGLAVGFLKTEGMGPGVPLMIVNADGKPYDNWLGQMVALTGMPLGGVKQYLIQGRFIDLLTAIHDNLKN